MDSSDELNHELGEGQRLALSLVDHCERVMAGSCTILVQDRAQEYEVVVSPATVARQRDQECAVLRAELAREQSENRQFRAMLSAHVEALGLPCPADTAPEGMAVLLGRVRKERLTPEVGS